MPSDKRISYSVYLLPEENEKVNQLCEAHKFNLYDLMTQLIEIAAAADRDFTYYKEPSGLYRLPNGHNRILRPFKISPETRDLAQLLAEQKSCTVSLILRAELARNDLERNLQPKKKKPPTLTLMQHQSAKRRCDLCFWPMFLRERRQDYYCCNCRNTVAVQSEEKEVKREQV